MTTSTAEAVQFWLLGGLAVLGAIAMVCATKAVYSALFLAVTMIILAVFYIAQGAMFLGVVQIVVYTGAVMMLFLFVLMLVGVDSADSLTETMKGQRPAAVAAGIGFGLVVIGAIGNASVQSGRPDFVGLDAANAGGNVEGLAELIFIRYLWAFELTGALLIVATVGAMILAHREHFEERKDQRALSEQRFKDGSHVTPMPSPGVYARHNAVDWPARLPDGSPSELSVNPMHRGHRGTP
ncbi:NADH-quinone oxidoreductase subunit J [Rhodococcoides kyotonense]|uniref:NADH-quinone oxidoreductase subunit J n=1 Tax=Rhodococcoides kyotonense TaxID=398843 RepID=A0A239D4I0_9NOCA|nr:NADH-quinone oxidoreductase subunit J [Rhodococcus kyotonensis]SNS27325.1 NADH-quinone oxidoreductase subunit J [Rhodococcus kyotonensis]